VVEDKDGNLRMWYVTRREIPGYTGSAREYTLRYAKSTDGVKWILLTRPFLLEKPQLLLNTDAANGEVNAALTSEE
jgi:hypothetical protein